jgi:hypothetical protein
LRTLGKTVFCEKAKRSKKEQEEPEVEDEIAKFCFCKNNKRIIIMEDDAPDNEVNVSGRVCRQKGWWKRGDLEAKLNTVNMTAWVHKECDIMDEEALVKLQEAWNNPEQKDECIVRLDDLERDYWMDTEVGQLEGYGRSDIGCGWVVQRWEDGVRVLQIQGRRE